MQKISIEAFAREHLKTAAASTSGRAAGTVFGGHERVMRQTVIALLTGVSLSEHENPGEATIYVLSGRVRLKAGDDVWEGRTGDFLIVPDARHSLEAVEDSTVLMTVAKTS
ncbi:cupin domain-containing protein [Cryobacterium cryoconiti]|uniref:Cupin domain-containing protein n=1 Tax=Cryobacterium cryoconiti TaxID=1259239 RepID=A0A4Y8JZX4_9MICO|nr:cupin domain-containing protein [Cryobacterium cryoconiti]TFD33220.1 cupin domain-containing protein [Cryobacterium cryoconiti]